MGAITFNGLSSGLDTASIVSQLVSIERNSANAPTTRKSNIDSQKNIISSMSSSLSALATAVRALDVDTEVRPRTTNVSDARIGVAASATAAFGTHDLRVKSLASGQVTQSRTFTSSAAGVLGAGGVDITVAGTTKSVAWTATDSLDAIATKINDAAAGVTASVVQVDATQYRLVVSAKDTGTAKAATFVDTGDGLDLANVANAIRPATDAIVNVDGVDITRSTNSISDALTGVTLTLNSVHAATDPSAKATVSLDNSTINSKVQKVVDSFNAINAALHLQLDYTGTKKGENTLFGDSTMRGLQGALATLKSNSYGTNTTVGAIGITVDQRGNMTFDSSKLSDALSKDPDALSNFFITNGFVTQTTALTDRYIGAAGLLPSKTQALTDRQKALQDQIDRINKRADDLQTRLEAQFNALEQAMSKLKTQSSYISANL